MLRARARGVKVARARAYDGSALMRRLLLLTSMLLAGCPPDLSGYEIVGGEGRADGGTGAPNPIDLGPACGDPHLVIGTSASSGTARLLRWDLASDALCR